MIFKPIVPLEDEYLPSIIERLYLYLGFKNARSFRHYLYGVSFIENEHYYPPHYPQSRIFDFLGIENYSELILKHTEYPFIAALSEKYDQLRFIGSMFEIKDLNYRVAYQGVKRCPECDREKAYIRRSHNLPGVSVCYRHKCSLAIDGNPIKRCISQEDIDYAIFANDFANSCFDFSITELNIAVSNRKIHKTNLTFPQKLAIVMNKYTSVKDIRIECTKPSFQTDGFDVLYNSNNLLELICKRCGEHFCTTYCGYKAGFLCPECQSKFTEEELFHKRFKNIAEGQYIMLTSFVNQSKIIKFLHLNSGTVIVSQPNRFLCNVSDSYYDPEILSQFQGRVQDYAIKSFDKESNLITVENNKNKEQKQMTIQEVSSLIKNITPHVYKGNIEEELNILGYKALTPYLSTVDKMTLVCKNGHLRKISISSLRLHPLCPECKKAQKIAERKNQDNSEYNMSINYIKNNFKTDEIFKREDITDKTVLKWFNTIVNDSGNELQIRELAFDYYSLGLKELKPSEIIESYYICGYRHHGFYVDYSFWKLIGAEVEEQDVIYLCTSAVKYKISRMIRMQLFTLFPVPDYFSKDKMVETQLIFSLNKLTNYMKDRTIRIYSYEYIIKNNLDLGFINKHLKEKFDAPKN